MPLTWEAIQANAVTFSKRWKDGYNEEAQAQSFLMDFFKVFGLSDPEKTGAFEYRVPLDDGRTGYIDYLWKKRIAVEMKSLGKDLNIAYRQLKDYVVHLADDEIPDLLMVCDFATVILHSRTTGKKVSFKTKDLRKNIKRFADIAGYETTREYENQVEVNVKAAEKMASLHDALETYGYNGHSLEVYLVRLLFCLFADDSGIFPQDCLLNYLENSKEDGSDLSDRIGKLFEVLNMSDEVRAKRTLLSADLKQFRYINGGLFQELLPSADFDVNMRRLLIECCKFDWCKISPAIFGAMFQGVMDKAKRRELGAHYTSEENILKVINPLFVDDLWREFEQVKADSKKLDLFHDKISHLKFFDPACGCGNFLLIAYRELRLLELEILKMKVTTGQQFLDLSSLLKVSVEQFYGIELEGFPCQIAQAGMWLMDHLMNLRAADMFGSYYVRLPLTESAHIVHGNALRVDWGNVVPKDELNFILGNPPFSGRRYRTSEQIKDVAAFFSYKDIDYVACWYKKAAQMIQGTNIECAFVSTNSICQGEQVAALWEELIKVYHIEIEWAYRTFKWSNEAKGKAAVHCVIIGFGNNCTRSKMIFTEDGTRIVAKHINGYLVDGPDVFLKVRTVPLCEVPRMKNGNVPLDGNALKVESVDATLFKDCKYLKRLVGGRELLYNEARYVLWLVEASPAEIQAMPLVKARVERCRLARLGMQDAGTRILAETPTLFRDTNNPQRYIALPTVSSENRKYIPMVYLDGSTIPTNQVQIIEDATLYHFGVLTSSVHNAWMRAVCGRLKSDYRYSKDIVYNNFPWPDVQDNQKAEIEMLAQGVLNARALFPDCNLADLYDPLTMPLELLKAHKMLDAAVMSLYGFSSNMPEAGIVSELMRRYQKLVLEKN